MFSSDSEEETISFCTPPDLVERANEATADLLPNKSKKIYEVCYKRFTEWCETKSVGNITENVVLAYLKEKSEILKPSTLWSEYSMLKATLLINNNVEIRNFQKLIPFLKKKSVGYRPKKSKVFSREQLDKFLVEAPDSKYLMMKVKYKNNLFLTLYVGICFF